MQAYQTLSDPVSRQHYNAQLEQALQDADDDYTGQQLCVVELVYATRVCSLLPQCAAASHDSDWCQAASVAGGDNLQSAGSLSIHEHVLGGMIGYCPAQRWLQSVAMFTRHRSLCR